MDKILILDFGSQTTQLISRRIREIGVYSEIIPGDTPLTADLLTHVKGIILSGSPFSVHEAGAPQPDQGIYSCGLPLLGICYGLQRMIQDHGGKVEPRKTKEYGRARINILKPVPLFHNVPDRFRSWMSHGDTVLELANDFELAAESENGLPATIVYPQKQFYGIQFHPEVSHCEYGLMILKNFTIRICEARKEWNMDRFFQQERELLRQKIGAEPVLLLISGGVDSTVVAALLLAALDPKKVHLMYIDTGLMRKGETVEVQQNLQLLGAKHIHIIHAAEEFYQALQEITDPEQKRKIIGDLFIKIQRREVSRLKINNAFLAQGTLYPDMIESGAGVGKKAHVIKSHHNVGTPLVKAKRGAGRLIEPLAVLYKDEVRELGRLLKVPQHVISRHPFPGPGLAVRILGEVTPEKCRILQEADYIYIEELRDRGLYDQIWQAFCVLLPIRSVGIAGDIRKYGYVLALRAVLSLDAMTADVFPFPTDALLEISSRITNSVPEIGRIVYDVSSKPPATIEWE
jgi:GMP synthase (glutamine-hydrolysing)